MYCRNFLSQKIYGYGLIIAVSFLTIFINEFAVFVFEKLVYIEKNHTRNDETISLFKKIIILQFVDTAFVNLVVNWKVFDKNGPAILAWFSLFNG